VPGSLAELVRKSWPDGVSSTSSIRRSAPDFHAAVSSAKTALLATAANQPKTPPGTWKMAWSHANADRMSPNCTGVSDRSHIIASPAIDMLSRSTYDTSAPTAISETIHHRACVVVMTTVSAPSGGTPPPPDVHLSRGVSGSALLARRRRPAAPREEPPLVALLDQRVGVAPV
jgi:hypothetical protein